MRIACVLVICSLFCNGIFAVEFFELTQISSMPFVEIGEGFQSLALDNFLYYCGAAAVAPSVDDGRCHKKPTVGPNPAAQLQHTALPRYSFLQIKNTTPHEQALVLEHELAITDRVTIENLSDASRRTKAAGSAVGVASRDYRTAFPAFKINLPAHKMTLLRISIASSIVTAPEFMLFGETAFFEHNQSSNIVQALFYGLVACMLAYNLLLFVRLRLRLYLLYICFLTSVAVVYLQIYGHGFIFLWSDQFWIERNIRDIAKCFAGLFVAAFITELLHVESRMPRLYRSVRAAYPAFILAAASVIFLRPMAFFAVSNICVFLGVAYSLFLSALSIMGKLPFSFYYTIAMLSLLIGAATNLLAVQGLLPATTFTIYSMQVGTALEAIFLSLALGDRYANIQNENLALQRMRIEDKKNIARDIHDVVGTEFQMRLIEIESQGAAWSAPKMAEALRSTLNKIREFLFLLHTDENLPSQIENNITELVSRLEAVKNFEIQKDIRIASGVLSTSSAYHLERAVSEIIANIARHAEARKIRILLSVRARGGFLLVADDGKGFDQSVACPHIGIESLKYRAQRLRGRLRISTAPMKGTTVAIRFQPV